MDWSKWLSNGEKSVNKVIRFKAPMLRLDLCDYIDAYVVVNCASNILAAAVNEHNK